jgi:hypothetical protein
MFHSLVRRGRRQTEGPPKGRGVGFALFLVVSFVTAAGGTAWGTGEGGYHTWTSTLIQNADWGHLIGHGTTNDCLWMSHSIKSSRSGPGTAGYVTAAPELYTYGSVDGKGPQQAPYDAACKNTNQVLPRQQLAVQQSLGHWLHWMNDYNGGWAWCNNGPWVYNTSAAYDHDAVTAYTWVPWPCQDQSANGSDNWYFGYHYVWGGPARIGGEVYLPAVSDWIQVFFS